MSLSLNSKHLHHAYLILGEREAVLTELKDFLFAEQLATPKSTDLHVLEFDSLGINDAHELRREQSMYAAEGSLKIFIVAFHTITIEAQNALLKTIEEPTPLTHFFFITRSAEVLLPTVRSRMQVIEQHTLITEKGKDIGEKFVTASIPERLKMVEKFTKVKADDKSKAKDDARIFLISLEHALASRLHGSVAVVDAVHDTITANRYLSDRSPSVKLLLEHLALTIPKLS